MSGQQNSSSLQLLPDKAKQSFQEKHSGSSSLSYNIDDIHINDPYIYTRSLVRILAICFTCIGHYGLVVHMMYYWFAYLIYPGAVSPPR